jgi:hypothetical protein
MHLHFAKAAAMAVANGADDFFRILLVWVHIRSDTSSYNIYSILVNLCIFNRQYFKKQ